MLLSCSELFPTFSVWHAGLGSLVASNLLQGGLTAVILTGRTGRPRPAGLPFLAAATAHVTLMACDATSRSDMEGLAGRAMYHGPASTAIIHAGEC